MGRPPPSLIYITMYIGCDINICCTKMSFSDINFVIEYIKRMIRNDDKQDELEVHKDDNIAYSKYIIYYIMNKYDIEIKSIIDHTENFNIIDSIIKLFERIIDTDEFNLTFRKYTRYRLYTFSNIFSFIPKDEVDRMLEYREQICDVLVEAVHNYISYQKHIKVSTC